MEQIASRVRAGRGYRNSELVIRTREMPEGLGTNQFKSSLTVLRIMRSTTAIAEFTMLPTARLDLCVEDTLLDLTRKWVPISGF